MAAAHELLKLLQYDDWANRESLRAIQGTQLHRSRKLLAHIISAEKEWLSRLNGIETQPLIWPEWTFAECEEHLAELASAWRDTLMPLESEQLEREITSTNSKGEVFKGTVRDIVMHVVLHSSYHRGQIATDQRLSGAVPPFTDFVHCIRKGFVE